MANGHTAQVTFGQIGCGYWGPNLLRNVAASPRCHMKWVAEASPARQAYVTSTHPDVRIAEDAEPLLNDDEVDAIIVATPAATHFELARLALQAGKHVLVEKPLAQTVSEVDELAALARDKDLVLMAGHTFLYNAAVTHLQRLVASGDLGELFYIYSQRVNLGQVRSDVNAWWNLAPHDVSILLHLMNGTGPADVTATGVAYLQPGIQDVAFGSLIWDHGPMAHIHVSWLDPDKIRRMTVVGSRKMVVYDDISDNKIAIYDKGFDRVPRSGERMDYDHFEGIQLVQRSGDVSFPPINFVEPLAVEIDHFVDCITNGSTPLTGAAHAREVVRILDLADRSMSSSAVTSGNAGD